MPSSAEHAKRVKEGLAFLKDPHAVAHGNVFVTENFYTALHMLEAITYDFTAKPKTRHYYSHSERNDYLRSIQYDTSHFLFGVVNDYHALRRLSEQARYLSPAGSIIYDPLDPTVDIQLAAGLFKSIRENLESGYASHKKKAPWL